MSAKVKPRHWCVQRLVGAHLAGCATGQHHISALVLKDLWPHGKEVYEAPAAGISPEMEASGFKGRELESDMISMSQASLVLQYF